jgi:hypothetical protein
MIGCSQQELGGNTLANARRYMIRIQYDNVPLDVMVDEITHHDKLQKLHDHDPLTNV